MDCFADGVFRDGVVVFVVGDDCGEYVGGCCVDVSEEGDEVVVVLWVNDDVVLFGRDRSC